MKRPLRIAAIVLLVLMIGAGGYMLYMVGTVKDTIVSIYEPLQPAEAAASPANVAPFPANAAPSPGTEAVVKPANREDGASGDAAAAEEKTAAEVLRNGRPADLNQGDPFTLLVLGVDERVQDRGRSDSIMVLGVNPAKRSVLMFNIPRDTRTEIVGRGTQDKINHAYAFGGVPMAVNTVESFLNVPIDYYVKVNMEGFAKIIDILGGVKIDNPTAFTYEGVTFPEGPLALGGRDALLYARMRYDDPRGDLGRNARQQRILADLIKRAKQLTTMSKLPDILGQVKENTKTNLTMDDMIDIYTRYKEQIDTITKDEVKGSNTTINKVYYYSVSEQERARIRSKLAEQLK